MQVETKSSVSKSSDSFVEVYRPPPKTTIVVEDENSARNNDDNHKQLENTETTVDLADQKSEHNEIAGEVKKKKHFIRTNIERISNL